MGLKDLKSRLDVAGGFGGGPGQTATAQNTIGGPAVKDAIPDPNFNTLNGSTDSPFYSKNGTGDHLKDLLLDKIVRSTNSPNIYDPQQMKGIAPGPPVPGQDQDLDGVNGGQGYFHGVANPQIGQGKQINGKDLHEHLLTDSYNYNHGNSVEQVSPSSEDFDGLDVGAPGGPKKFDGGVPSKVHGHPAQIPNPTELVRDYISTVNPNANHGNSQWPIVPSVPGGNNQNSPFQDLDGGYSLYNTPGNTSVLPDLLTQTYNSTTNPLASYGAGQPGGTWPKLEPSPLSANPSMTNDVYADLDGGLPTNGQYINNLPQ